MDTVTPPLKLNWKNEVAVCIASGPSLTQEDIDYVRGRARVIVINKTWERAPWADVLYACDKKWWERYFEEIDFPGHKYRLEAKDANFTGVHVLKNTGKDGIDLTWPGIRTGQNSGYQAINLAAHFGVKRIVLLGYDVQPGNDGRNHWHEDYPKGMVNPNAATFKKWVRNFESLAKIIKKIPDFSVINATRKTALTCFHCAPLRTVL